MSNSIKDLFEFNLVKQCSSCKSICLKSSFNKNKSKLDHLESKCRECLNNFRREFMKEYYNNNRDKKKLYKKNYFQENKSNINDYFRNKRNSDFTYKLARNTRGRIHKAIERNSKLSSTTEILGIDFQTYRKWIEFQMNDGMTWFNIEIDHVKPISLFNILLDEELKKAFNWINTQPLLKDDNRKKGVKFNNDDYQLQFKKAEEFIKLNEERYHQDFH